MDDEQDIARMGLFGRLCLMPQRHLVTQHWRGPSRSRLGQQDHGSVMFVGMEMGERVLESSTRRRCDVGVGSSWQVSTLNAGLRQLRLGDDGAGSCAM
jgi:hypothetical protein